MKKNFVLDTNILINNPKCIIDSFDDNDVILPFKVIEELDNLKNKDNVGYYARETLRNIEKIRNGSNFISKGVQRNDKGGLLRIVTIKDKIDLIKDVNLELTNNDNLIVCTAIYISRESERKTIFVSNDCNARIKASFFNIDSERYLTDVVPEEYLTYTGMRKVEMPLTFFGSISSDGDFSPNKNLYTIDLSEEPFNEMNIIENEFVLVDVCKEDIEKYDLSRKEKKHLKHVYRRTGDLLYHKCLDGIGYANVKPKNLEQSCAIDLLMDRNVEVVTLRGPAGTGKNFIGTASVLQQVINEKIYDKVVFLKPTITAHEDIGFLPGNTHEKIMAYMGSFLDNISILKKMETINTKTTNNNDFQSLVNAGVIEVENIGFLRGRSISDSIIILDESQNISKSVMKTIVTRVGMNSKIIILGDTSQIDAKHLSVEDNGLSYLIKKFRGQNLYGHITLNKCERSTVSRLAGEIL